MFELDVRSIVSANFAYTTVITLFLLFFGHRSFRRLPGLNWWAYGFVLFTAGFLFISFRDYVPVPVSNIIPHFLTILGFYFIKMGLARFYDVRPRLWWDGLFLILSAVSLVFTVNNPIRSRILVIVLSALAAYSLSLGMLWNRQGTRTLKLLYIIAGVIQLVRLWLGYSIPRGVDPMAAGLPMALISMLFFLSLMMISLSLISITVRHLLQDRDSLLEKEKINSITDELTGLMNRRGFKAVYNVEEKRSARRKSQLSLVMADVDGFKLINDRFGHDCGDEVLKYVAEVFRREFRGGDLLVRWGGEEFLIVQPETNAEACRTSLERTRQAVARKPFRRDDDVFYVTMSFGFYTAVAGNLGFDAHLKRADDNMYAAKRGGKNRVVGGNPQ